MLGPHFYYDLIRIARKGRTTLLRCVYLLALLGGIWYISHDAPGAVIDRNRLARTGQNVANTVIVLQYALVLVLTPALVSGTIVDERQRGTLELLFTTQLTDREIVLGKLGAGFANLAVMLLASLPVLALVHSWGGLDVERALLHYLNALLFLLFACAACLWASAENLNLRDAMIVSYALVFFFGYFAVGLTFGTNDFPAALRPIVLMALAILHFGGTAFFAWLAIGSIRRWRSARRLGDRPRAMPRRPKRPRTRRASPPPRAVARPSRLHPLARTIRGRALLWKEYIRDGDAFSLSCRWLGWLGLAVALLSLCRWLWRGAMAEPEWPAALPVIGVIYSAVAYFYLSGIATHSIWTLIRVTSTVAREREAHTLDALLLLPVTRSEILASKWLGAIGRGWPAFAVAYAAVLLGLGCGLYGPLGAVSLVLLPWPIVLMFSTLGLLLSVGCRVRTAYTLMAVALVAVFIGHVLCYRDVGLMLRVIASGVLGWEGDRFERGEWLLGLYYILAMEAGYLILAALFAALAFWRFERGRSAPAGKAW